MADSPNYIRSLNPWVLHLQKMGLELKCPLCLNLLNRPMLLPCNHIFCNFCIPKSTQFGSECPPCKVQYVERDLRPAPYMENMVTIYRSLDATFCTNLFQPVSSDGGRVSEQHPVSVNTVFDDELRKEPVETAQEGNSSCGQSIFSLMANKRVRVPLNHSAEDGNRLTGKFDKCGVPRDCKGEEPEMCNRGGVGFHGKGKLTSPPPCSQLRAARHEDLGRVEIDINQVSQSSPGSPPSFGDTKCIDDDGNYLGSGEDSAEKYPTKRSVKKIYDDQAGKEMNDRPTSGSEEGPAPLKRQKKLNYEPLEMGVKTDGHSQPVVSHSEHIAISNAKLEPKFGKPISGEQSPTISDSLDANKTVCAFCQSPELTEATGPMLHYANGNPVVGDEAARSNVIHVHMKCIEWAPQVYYVGETVMNLEAELARGAKLKCSSCGLKGAALGCYAKSCRKSFHVPCAVEVKDCRWDCVNFLVLCPTHSYVKFPNEKSKCGKHASKKHPVSTQITPQQDNFWAASPNGVKEWVLCGSALSAEEKFLLVKFASMSGITVSKFWKPNVSHVIAATDAEGACCRTLKVLMAILNGRWILKIDWIKACMEAMHPVDEEPYEIRLDNYGFCDGPKTGRLRALDNAPKLFSGLSFYFSGDFVLEYKGYLQDLVRAAGGTVLDCKEQLAAQGHDAQATPSRALVVYNLDPPQGCKLGEEIPVELRRLEAEDLAAQIGSLVIGHTWLLGSIAACKLQSFARR